MPDSHKDKPLGNVHPFDAMDADAFIEALANLPEYEVLEDTVTRKRAEKRAAQLGLVGWVGRYNVRRHAIEKDVAADRDARERAESARKSEDTEFLLSLQGAAAEAMRRALAAKPGTAEHDEAIADVCEAAGCNAAGAKAMLADVRPTLGRAVRLNDPPPPPREWIMPPWLCVGYIAMLTGPGGRGKSSLLYAVALSILTGKPFAGFDVRKPGGVLMLVLEDDWQEFWRRFKAASRTHLINGQHVTEADLDGRPLHVVMMPPRLAYYEADERGRQTAVINHAAVAELVLVCKLLGIVVLMVDPFWKAHAVNENLNSEMGLVMAALAAVADRAKVAVLVSHHDRKGGAAEGGNAADAARGASVITTSARMHIAVGTMTEKEAKALAVPLAERRQYIRADLGGKANLTPATSAAWFRLINHDLRNETEDNPHSDHVGVVVPWKPDMAAIAEREAAENSPTLRARGLRFINTPPVAGELWTLNTKIESRKLVPALAAELGVEEARARELVKRWTDAGDLVLVEYTPPGRKAAKGYKVPADRLAAAVAAAEAAAGGDGAEGLGF